MFSEKKVKTGEFKNNSHVQMNNQSKILTQVFIYIPLTNRYFNKNKYPVMCNWIHEMIYLFTTLLIFNQLSRKPKPDQFISSSPKNYLFRDQFYASVFHILSVVCVIFILISSNNVNLVYEFFKPTHLMCTQR